MATSKETTELQLSMVNDHRLHFISALTSFFAHWSLLKWTKESFVSPPVGGMWGEVRRRWLRPNAVVSAEHQGETSPSLWHALGCCGTTRSAAKGGSIPLCLFTLFIWTAQTEHSLPHTSTTTIYQSWDLLFIFTSQSRMSECSDAGNVGVTLNSGWKVVKIKMHYRWKLKIKLPKSRRI